MIPTPYREISPSPRLARYVECYWSRVDENSGDHLVLPDGCADILFTQTNAGLLNLDLVGLMTKPLPVAAKPGTVYFGIRFHPGMAAALVPEAAVLIDQAEPLEKIWSKTARSLSERLADACDVAQMVRTAEQALRPLEPPDFACRVLWRLSQSAASLDELVAASGLSHRHFRRQCLARSGVSPKHLQRILRFRKALERIRALHSRPAQPSWAQLAVICGYYDQAHFNREFQQFAGCPPGRFLQSLRAANGLKSDHDEPT